MPNCKYCNEFFQASGKPAPKPKVFCSSTCGSAHGVQRRLLEQKLRIRHA